MSLLFTNAQVLGPDGVMASALRIDRGLVAALDASPKSTDVVIDLEGAIISPGLINAHDHLQLNNFGRLKWRDRYSNASEWIADFNARFGSDPNLDIPKSAPLQDRLFIGRLKNILAGVTTVCHHDPLFRSLRRRFPNRSVTRYGWSHSLFLEEDSLIERSYHRTPDDWPWIIHLAEGTDQAASQEFARLDQLGCVQSNTIIVHGVGLSVDDQMQLLDRGGGLIWCPSSNLFMLGKTTDVGQFIGARKVALGSDSRLSGERDLLAELHLAGKILAKASVLNDDSRVQPSQGLFRMVTLDAARMLNLPQLGRIEAGLPADLVVFPSTSDVMSSEATPSGPPTPIGVGHGRNPYVDRKNFQATVEISRRFAPRNDIGPGDNDPFANLIHSRRSDLRLVMFEGRPVIGDLDMKKIFVASNTRFDRARLDDRDKLIDHSIARRLERSVIPEDGLEITAL